MIRFENLIHLSVLLTTVAGYTYVPCADPVCFRKANTAQLATSSLRLYGASINQFTDAPIATPLVLVPKLALTKPTIVYTYGWNKDNAVNEKCTHAIIRALIALNCCNIILYNWNTIAFGDYEFAARSVEGVGFTLATALNALVTAGVVATGVQLIGHGLGAHVTGFTGKSVNFVLPRITGLDPSGPGFYFMSLGLERTDAQFVSVIHTDACYLGTNMQLGTVDFYPNGGTRVQPGCEKSGDCACSHFRACWLFAESIKYQNSFISVACDSYDNYLNGACCANPTSVMGYSTPPNVSGKYYLETNSEPLYCRGEYMNANNQHCRYGMSNRYPGIPWIRSSYGGNQGCGPGFNEEYGQGYIQISNQGCNQNYNQNGNQNCNQNCNQNGNQNCNRNGDQNCNEDCNQNCNQNGDQNCNKGHNQNPKKNYNQGYDQNDNQGYDQNDNQGYDQNDNQGYGQNDNQEYNQKSKQNYYQYYKQQYNQTYYQNYNQTYYQNYKANNKQDYNQNYKANNKHNHHQNHKANNNQDYNQNYW